MLTRHEVLVLTRREVLVLTKHEVLVLTGHEVLVLTSPEMLMLCHLDRDRIQLSSCVAVLSLAKAEQMSSERLTSTRLSDRLSGM